MPVIEGTREARYLSFWHVKTLVESLAESGFSEMIKPKTDYGYTIVAQHFCAICLLTRKLIITDDENQNINIFVLLYNNNVQIEYTFHFMGRNMKKKKYYTKKLQETDWTFYIRQRKQH